MITQEEIEIASLGKFKLCKMTTYHVNLLQRYSHLHISTFMTLILFLSGAISSSNRHTKDAHARVDWLDQWQVGIGLMGEQGAEAIHAYFNNLKVTYRNSVEKQHYVYIAIACRPPPVKRQKKNDN